VFEFVEQQKAVHRIATMCRVLGVSTSGYYAWRKRPESQRHKRDSELTAKIVSFYERSRCTYGAPRIHAELAYSQVRCGRKRVARLMRAAGLQGVHRRKRAKTTKQDRSAAPAPDLVIRNFSAETPNNLWIADITYVRTWSGWLYLAVVIDVFSRKVVGWSMADHLRTELVIDALDMALWNRRPVSELVHHSDRGCQYTSLAFGRRCREAGIASSMGRTGSAYDNAMAEAFFATLETELLMRQSFANRSAARLAVFDYIEGFYNTHRRHSALGYLSPVDFERRHQDKLQIIQPVSVH
jgi:putative transposase